MDKRAITWIVGLMLIALIGSIGLQFYWIYGSVKESRKAFDGKAQDALRATAKFLSDAENYASQSQLIQRGFLSKDLGDRIGNVQQLDKVLRENLADRGINMNYGYGVYSLKKRTFVIQDGSHLYTGTGSNLELQKGYDDLLNSKFQVFLYSSRGRPGKLMIYFPGLTTEVWKTAWLPLLASIVFTSIIFFSFVYSLRVIYRQKKVSEMKTDFINNMTHEFKTPIATISLAADSITSPMISGSPDKVNRFATIIKQENKRMLSQVEKVLQMAQLDKENFNLKITDINMHALIEQATVHANLQVAQKEGEVTTDLKAKKAVIQGDMTHVSNIIHNLLDNANKYTPEKPEISIHTRNVSNGIEVTIKDNGIGMTKEARKHIFDKFYRVHTGNIHDVKGFGLGLSYVKAMMIAHKGQIDVKSELGKGSSFILHFPFYHES